MEQFVKLAVVLIVFGCMIAVPFIWSRRIILRDKKRRQSALPPAPPLPDEPYPHRWTVDPRTRRVSKDLNEPHALVMVDDVPRCWNCGYDMFGLLRPTTSVNLLTIIGLFFWPIWLLILALDKNSVCARCDQTHFANGSVPLSRAMDQ